AVSLPTLSAPGILRLYDNAIQMSSNEGWTTFAAEFSQTIFTSKENATAAFQIQNATGTSIFNVDSTNSRVGIGTVSPSTKLHIAETSNVSNTVTISNSSAGVGANVQVSFAASNRTYNVGVGSAGNFYDNQ